MNRSYNFADYSTEEFDTSLERSRNENEEVEVNDNAVEWSRLETIDVDESGDETDILSIPIITIISIFTHLS